MHDLVSHIVWIQQRGCCTTRLLMTPVKQTWIPECVRPPNDQHWGQLCYNSLSVPKSLPVWTVITVPMLWVSKTCRHSIRQNKADTFMGLNGSSSSAFNPKGDNVEWNLMNNSVYFIIYLFAFGKSKTNCSGLWLTCLLFVMSGRRMALVRQKNAWDHKLLASCVCWCRGNPSSCFNICFKSKILQLISVFSNKLKFSVSQKWERMTHVKWNQLKLVGMLTVYQCDH